MTIGEAIEIIDRVFRVRSASSDVTVFDAIILGREAMKYVKMCETHTHTKRKTLLLGETEEEERG